MNINYQPPQVIAEIGCNHKGDMEIAKELIKMASFFCKSTGCEISETYP